MALPARSSGAPRPCNRPAFPFPAMTSRHAVAGESMPESAGARLQNVQRSAYGTRRGEPGQTKGFQNHAIDCRDLAIHDIRVRTNNGSYMTVHWQNVSLTFSLATSWDRELTTVIETVQWLSWAVNYQSHRVRSSYGSRAKGVAKQSQVTRYNTQTYPPPACPPIFGILSRTSLIMAA